MESWGRQRANYPPELRERAVRMVAEVRADYPSEWAAIGAVAQRLGIGSTETLRKWTRRAEVDWLCQPHLARPTTSTHLGCRCSGRA
jgi:transposase